MKKIMIYVVDITLVNGNDYFPKDNFIKFAESQGTVFTLDQFIDLLNCDEINVTNSVIRKYEA